MYISRTCLLHLPFTVLSLSVPSQPDGEASVPIINISLCYVHLEDPDKGKKKFNCYYEAAYQLALFCFFQYQCTFK